MAISGAREINLRPFIKYVAVGGTTTAADGSVQSAELTLPAFGFETTLARICGMGQGVGLEHMLRIQVVGEVPSHQWIGGHPPGAAVEAQTKMMFECPQFLLNERRLNVETEIEPKILLCRTDKLTIICDVPMLLWLFGKQDVTPAPPPRDY